MESVSTGEQVEEGSKQTVDSKSADICAFHMHTHPDAFCDCALCMSSQMLLSVCAQVMERPLHALKYARPACRSLW